MKYSMILTGLAILFSTITAKAYDPECSEPANATYHACLDGGGTLKACTTKAQAVVLACEKDPVLIARADEFMCGLEVSKAVSETQIKQERSNPSGVMNLVIMHDAGQNIQEMNRILPGARASYLQTYRKAFNRNVCLDDNGVKIWK